MTNSPKSLPDRMDAYDREMGLLRGSEPLTPRGPIDSGILGQMWTWMKFQKRILGIVAATVLAGGFTGVMAVRDHLLNQGRALEKKEREVERLNAIEKAAAEYKKLTDDKHKELTDWIYTLERRIHEQELASKAKTGVRSRP